MPTTITLLAGVHTSRETIRFNSANTEGSLNIVGEPGAVISAAVPIKGWTKSTTMTGRGQRPPPPPPPLRTPCARACAPGAPLPRTASESCSVMGVLSMPRSTRFLGFR